MEKKKIKVFQVATECTPLAKVGGLGDVVPSLSKALFELGVDVSIFLPKYSFLKNFKFFDSFYFRREKINVYYDFLEGTKIKIFLFEEKKFLKKHKIYEGPALFSIKKFLLFSLLVFEFLKKFPFPKIVHCHDWHTAILPLILKSKETKNTRSVLTIHNLSHQGKWQEKEILNFLNLEKKIKSLEKKDKNRDFNILQQGILNADIITTVSPTYSKEILTKDFGMSLENDLKKRKKDLFGILNGIDTEVLDPEKDPYLKRNYSTKNFERKTENKIDLQKILKLKVDQKIPVFSFIGRLDFQKGIPLLINALPFFKKLNSQVVILGKGEKKFEEILKEISKKYSNVSIQIKFDSILAQKIYGGADFILMPSLFEPCGLVQMIAQRYGTIPIARKTGGLSDTIEDGKTGFLFEKYNTFEFLKAVKRGIFAFNDKSTWKKMVKRAMKKDFSWKKSAKKYLSLYKKLINGL
jgi:starch synthase